MRSAAGMPHPALAEPDGARWQEWHPPADGWIDVPGVQLSDAGDGIDRLAAESGGAPAYMRATFAREEGERFWGFGERADRVERSGSLVEHWVSEGPHQLDEYQHVEAIKPRWAIRRRSDATSYPIPWLLSSRGYGVLTDSHEWSCHDLTGTETWSVIALTDRLTLCMITASSPADALARFTSLTGRQPLPSARWFFGPWIQTHQRVEGRVAAVETSVRRMAGHAGDPERERTLELRSRGLASLTYLSPTIDRTLGAEFDSALKKRLFERDPRGNAITFTAYIGGREPPFTEQAQLDFANPTAVDRYRRLVERAFEDGNDGWMEDLGEYSPLLAEHNLYPLRYHRAVAGIAADLGRRPARLVRSGWTGSAAFSPLVWGGDPTTGWGFAGLRSAVIQGLSMGLSGVAFWGSDIGGFVTLGDERLTPELLIRWIQLGALTPLMRATAGGVMAGGVKRPQVWDRKVLPHWRRWSAFHDLLIPYLMQSAEEYARTGMPLMRHHVLTHPDDHALTTLEDQYLLGSDLLVAPVLEPGARKRTVRVPIGDWVDLWRSVDVSDDGLLLPRKARVLKGGRAHVLPAPLKEIPILIRAGASIPGIQV